MPHYRKYSITPIKYALILLPALFMCPLEGVFAEPEVPPVAKTGQIPPEILQQLLKQHSSDFARPAEPFHRRINDSYRVILAVFAVAVLFVGAILCRRFRSYINNSECTSLLLGLFGGIAAMLVTAACMGSLFIHLAASLCTIASGFCIAAFLIPQFNFMRKLMTGINPSKSTNGDNL